MRNPPHGEFGHGRDTFVLARMRNMALAARLAQSDRFPDSPRRRYTSLTFFSGKLRTGLPVAAKMAFITAGFTTHIVGSPTPPQKS